MEIIFRIVNGEVSEEVVNAEGKDCLNAVKPYEDALGDDTPDRKFKPEFRQTQQLKTSQKTRQL